MQFNIPTLLTLFRVILIPFFVLVFYLPVTWSPFAAALIFCVAAVTDWFDGFLARRWNQSTRFGAFLDPVADKVLVAIAMVLVTEHYHSWWVTLPAATMIAREIIILLCVNGWLNSVNVAVWPYPGLVKSKRLPRWSRWPGCCGARIFGLSTPVLPFSLWLRC